MAAKQGRGLPPALVITTKSPRTVASNPNSAKTTVVTPVRQPVSPVTTVVVTAPVPAVTEVELKNGSASPTKASNSAPVRSRLVPASWDQMERFVSFEFFPPRTTEGTQNLIRRIDNMGKLKPLYIDITSNPRKRLDSLEICAEALMYCGVNVMLHIVCAEETKEGIRELLDSAKRKGIRNLMVLRGDVQESTAGQQPAPVRTQDFPRAADLIRFIRKEYGDWFCLACAGYPEGQEPRNNPKSYEQDLQAVKEKVEAGAEFIVTQLFFDISRYVQYVKDCRALGINVPIVPGIMPIQLYKIFDRTVKYLGTRVPEEIRKALEPIKEDDAAVRDFGIDLAERMACDLIEAGAPGVHFFTLNLERTVTTVVERLGEKGVLCSRRRNRDLPWTQSAHEKRANESVRPIFWSNKPKSYVERTQAWDEFPNGRWGDASSPAYGELKGSHYYNVTYGPVSDRLVAWGENPLDVSEIAKVFVAFVEGRVEYLPWSESGLALETSEIRSALVSLNLGGFLTVNSQPRVNAAHSSDPTFGWGPSNGYVYQKAYIEFFVCEEGMRAMYEALEKYPSLDFHAINHKGDEKMRRSSQDDAPCAVTWGVFPGREILQPTIVDPVSFRAWKDEAFELWIQAWANIYSDSSPSHALIWEIHDNFWLVNLVDNDYINGDIFKIFEELDVKEAAALGLSIRGEF